MYVSSDVLYMTSYRNLEHGYIGFLNFDLSLDLVTTYVIILFVFTNGVRISYIFFHSFDDIVLSVSLVSLMI